MATMRRVIVGGVYKHYRGDRYVVLHEAKHSETLEDLIVYRRCNSAEVWVRPRDMFNECVWVSAMDGGPKYVPRFRDPCE